MKQFRLEFNLHTPETSGNEATSFVQQCAQYRANIVTKVVNAKNQFRNCVGRNKKLRRVNVHVWNGNRSKLSPDYRGGGSFCGGEEQFFENAVFARIASLFLFFSFSPTADSV